MDGDTSLRDIPATLRELADEIERGEHGAVRGIAWALDCTGSVVPGYAGQVPELEPVPVAVWLLSAGAHQLLAQQREEERP